MVEVMHKKKEGWKYSAVIHGPHGPNTQGPMGLIHTYFNSYNFKNLPINFYMF